MYFWRVHFKQGKLFRESDWIWPEESIPCRGKSECDKPEVEQMRNHREVSAARASRARGSRVGMEVREDGKGGRVRSKL